MLSVSFLRSFMPGAIAPKAKVELCNLLSSPSHLKGWEQEWDLPSQGVRGLGLSLLHCLHARRGAVTRRSQRCSCVRQDLRTIVP